MCIGIVNIGAIAFNNAFLAQGKYVFSNRSEYRPSLLRKLAPFSFKINSACEVSGVQFSGSSKRSWNIYRRRKISERAGRAPTLDVVDIPREVTFAVGAILFFGYLPSSRGGRVPGQKHGGATAAVANFGRRRRQEERLLAQATKAYGKVRRDRPRRDRRGIKISETVKGRGDATDD